MFANKGVGMTMSLGVDRWTYFLLEYGFIFKLLPAFFAIMLLICIIKKSKTILAAILLIVSIAMLLILPSKNQLIHDAVKDKISDDISSINNALRSN